MSSTFSPVSKFDNSITDPNAIMKSILVNIFPKDDLLNIVFGFCYFLSSPWIRNYIDSWENCTHQEIELKISDLIATKSDIWALSSTHAVNNPKINELLKYWDENLINFYDDQEFKINIFR